MSKPEILHKKLKTKHSIVREAMPYIKELLKLDFVHLIIPNAIDNNSHGKLGMRISAVVDNGFRLNFGGAGAQKFHLVCSPTPENRRAVIKALMRADEG